ncbi:penicillin acylase family protein [Fodinibius sediminis]|uniref:Penicillin amidase n=1 Tax=Fodinibius sediminis TaxID=1214077 RepID=A0A521D013_9BACT|nr:penicillin acylase family protein [Fodinibius sediminis]SMO65036.1 penicillin amidase [Fodinibius sediminis]
MKKILGIVLGFVFFIAGLTAIAIYWTFYQPLPDYKATIKQTELQQPVNIHWDSHGVPHIYADNKQDLYYSLGYVHAQDRLWQMTVSQMAAQGRFAEFLGEELLPLDIMQRTIGFWRTAQKIEASLADTTRRYLQAYAAGVNGYVHTHPDKLPIHFALADMDPIPWTPTHSVALSRLMAWELNLSWKSELTYAHLSEELPEEKFLQLRPDNRFLPRPVPTDTSDSLTASLLPLLDLDRQLRTITGSQGIHQGSNAWAVAAEKSSTGAPMLAGDPHLGLGMPGKWYEVHLNTGKRNLAGATIPGAPMLVLGQNDHLAWSMTNVMLDDTDFFQEAVNPQNPEQFVLDTLAGEPLYENFTLQREVISIKNQDDTVFTRRLTKHGPVISDIYPQQELIGDRVVTMKWSGHEVSKEVEALLTMNWAQSLEEFQQGARQFKVPGQNFIYADKAGNIAQLSLANIPVRSGNPILLREGWDPGQDWQGYVPYEELPSEINPDRNWIANANNPPAGDNYPYYLSIYWEPDARYDRIRQYLTEYEQLSPEIFRQMQYDAHSLYARDMTQLILPVLKQHDQQFETVISYLENWDYSYELSETAASIMDVFLLRLAENTFQDEMDKDAYQKFIEFSGLPKRALMRLMQYESSFFDDVTTGEQESRNQIITRSMEEAISFLRSQYGAEPFEWRWEQLHTLTLRPPLFGEAVKSGEAPTSLKLIVNNLLNHGPFAARGHGMSINNGEYLWDAPYEMVLGPSIRRIIDFSNMNYTLSILPTGQSGNPFSAYYGDQTESWLNGQYKFLYQDESFLDRAQHQTMKLVPEQEG